MRVNLKQIAGHVAIMVKCLTCGYNVMKDVESTYHQQKHGTWENIHYRRYTHWI